MIVRDHHANRLADAFGVIVGPQRLLSGGGHLELNVFGFEAHRNSGVVRLGVRTAFAEALECDSEPSELGAIQQLSGVGDDPSDGLVRLLAVQADSVAARALNPQSRSETYGETLLRWREADYFHK
jgi:hypothetical protein